MDDDYERIICTKNEAFVYKIPPRASSRGYRAADWKLEAPDWTGRLKIVAKGNSCTIKLEDRLSYELFAKAPVTQYPGPAVEAVTDSSRYFVIKIEDDGGRHAFIGIGFSDRGDSFDFNVALQDFFKKEKVEEELQKEMEAPTPALDLGFKAGQTIKINIGSSTGEQKARPKPKVSGNIGILPPPPGGNAPKLVPPPTAATTPQQQQFAPMQAPAVSNKSQGQSVDWGDFASSNQSSGTSGGNWVQF